MVEEMVFHDWHFIKFVPNEDRPRFLEELFRGCDVGSNDFSSFESLIYGAVMDACECELYRWLGRDTDPGFIEYVCGTLLDKQSQRSRNGFRASLYGRQSGDMCTSVGNGWTNLVIMSFCAFKMGWVEWGRPIHGVFEGDDSAFKLGGEPERVNDLLARLGMRAKVVLGTTIGKADFLSTCWGPDLVPVRDFRKPYVFTPWIQVVEHRRDLLPGFLRAKGLSLAHEMAECPVLQAMSKFILRITAGEHARYLRPDAWWDRVIMGQSYGTSDVNPSLLARLQAPISWERRVFYARQFGVSVEAQLHLESLFNDARELKMPYDPVVAALLDPVYNRHVTRFTSRWQRDSQAVYLKNTAYR